MADARRIIEKLKSLADDEPETAAELIPFEISPDIDDSDEQDINRVADVYPSRADSPHDPGPDPQTLAAWRDGCCTLISGVSIHVGLRYRDAGGGADQQTGPGA